jgi:hypothetical protein
VVEIDCGDCGTKLVAVASTETTGGPYPSLWLTCPECGAAWQQEGTGDLIRRRDSL